MTSSYICITFAYRYLPIGDITSTALRPGAVILKRRLRDAGEERSVPGAGDILSETLSVSALIDTACYRKKL
jgi:hypothetical protein